MLEQRTPRLGRPPRYTVDQVLDAAERLPYDRLTMKSLADELDLVPSALYRYVKDRDDLVEQDADFPPDDAYGVDGDVGALLREFDRQLRDRDA